MWDRWWSELPPKGKAAAKELGFTPEIWDADEHVPYEEEKICDVTNMQKSAAMYLGENPIDKKCDIWWSEADPVTQKYAQIIGWDEHRWDHDWRIQDLPIEHKYWSELTDEEKEAAEYFGYCQVLWDEVSDDENLPNWGEGESKEAADDSEEEDEEEEKKEDEPEIVDEEVFSDEEESDEVEEVPDEEAAAAAGIEKEEEKPTKKKKIVFKKSKPYGGMGGSPFTLGNNRHIEKLVIWADRHICHGIQITVNNGQEKMACTADGKKHEIVFDDDEFITHVKVRSGKHIQSLTFRTNMGRTIGPIGGKGWRFGHDKPGQEVSVPAPFKRQLCGFSGKGGLNLDSIIFHWGPVPTDKQG